MRASGILMPIFSLPSRYGIGSFSREAYEFVDFLVEAGQKYWQILPIGPTGYGDSPYQSFSTFAGNPYFIDLEQLIQEGVLTRTECARPQFDLKKKIDYYKLYKKRYELLRLAYTRSNVGENEAFHEFQRENAYWLNDYALFMAIKDRFGGKAWDEWADDIRFRYPNAMEYYQSECYFDVEFYEYTQFLFFQQWMKLKQYANDHGVSIIGDIPIYVAFDSSDVWSHPDYFEFDEEGHPRVVAGCPPDGFAADGQLWGNPIYRWDYMKETGFDWWLRRIGACYKIYDAIRIDHFRGFDEFYAIPYGEETAVNGQWCKGPGIEFFRKVQETFGTDKLIIAEDLGYVTDTVKQLVADSGYPGMKVIEFAFDRRDSSSPVSYLPYNYTQNTVCYTGTHDNETLVGWLEEITPAEYQDVLDYLGIVEEELDRASKSELKFLKLQEKTEAEKAKAEQVSAKKKVISTKEVKPDTTGAEEEANSQQDEKVTKAEQRRRDQERLLKIKNRRIAYQLIRSVESSVSDLCIIPLQDYLGLGREARINTPSTDSGNWQWRVKSEQMTDDLAAYIKKLAVTYGRV